MKNIIIGIFVILFLTLLVSCDITRSIGSGVIPEKVNVNFDYDKFKQEESLWNSTKPPNYQFYLYFYVFGNMNNNTIYSNTLIFVENGKFKTQIPYVDMYGNTHETYRNETIIDIYDYIENEYLKFHSYKPSTHISYLAKIDIEYDTKNHIPVEVKLWYNNPNSDLDIPPYNDLIMITEYKIND
jgi:hypothetical protein